MTDRDTQKLNQSNKPPQQLKAGDLLQGRYQIQEVVGIGGMGSVYRARDTNFKAIRLVAIKEMISKVADQMVQKNISQIFEREANILATLRHSAIPRIFDYFSEDDRSYLVMEYVNGKDLDEILDGRSELFPEDQVLAWAIELCDVLGYLHSHKPEPIIFRDIKPSNIMVNLQNQIVLVDFGIAKVFQAGKKNTTVGTQGYAPPDQYRGEATPQVDIYALGATMHHLLTMKDPRLEAPFSFNERPIKSINPSVSDDVVAIVDRALQYKPEDRFDSAMEMKEALINAGRKTGLLSGSPISTSPISPQGVKPLWMFQCEDELRGTPVYYNGQVFIGCTDNNLYAIDASDGKFAWKYFADGAVSGKPALSDDNLYFGSEDHRLHVISTRSGTLLWTYYTDGPIRSSPRIAQGHVFVGSDDGNLHAVNSLSGRVSWKTEVGVPIRSSPFVGEENIFFGSESGELYCVNFAGELRWTFKAKRAISSSPFLANDAVYCSSLDGTLYALDSITGWVIWRFRMGKGSVSSPYINDRYIYVGSADHVIYCVDIHSSKEVWRFTTEHQVVGSPMVYSDSVYCGSADGYVYCLDKNSGNLRWKFRTEGPIIGTPTIYEGIVYIGSSDKNLYALLA
ncbi:MAG: serine/threonine-protein kinase [Anaerolineales bacterium]|nr:serine/threonine-protein kinase [Anaerolineales bacterium]